MPSEPSLPSYPGFARAVVEAARRATVGVVVARRGPSGFVCELASDRVVARLKAEPVRVPEDLGVSPRAAAAISRWLEDGPETTTVDDPEPDAWARVVLRRTEVGGRVGVVLFLYDSAVRRRAEQALAESEARFRLLLDTLPDVVALGTLRKFVYANPAAVRLLGYSSMEEVTRIPLRDHLHPEDRKLAHRIAETLLRGAVQPPVQLRVARKDGSFVHLELRPITLEWAGEPAMLGIARDLSERRTAQAQLVRADRLASMGTLAAGVGHEINNPLAYLMLNLQYLMRELPRFDGDPVRLAALLERLAEAEHGARRVSTIVGDLRSLARPEPTEFEPVSVPAAAAAAVRVAGAELRGRCRVEEDYGEAPPVLGSAVRLEQVFVNLLVNAAHAMPEGHPDEHVVQVRVRREGDRVVAEVKDDGCGIPPDVLERVFDPFFTTKPRGVGTGLGLPISRGIVKSFGGEIAVTSVVGTGTTFRLTLPALPGETRPARAIRAPSGEFLAVPPRRARVLVVDDEPLVADMIRRTLSDAHDVTVAHSATEAMDAVLSSDDFDVVFCDLLMPELTGMDLYDQLKARRPGVEERIVFMTGGAFTERAAHFLSSVHNLTMGKPFEPGQLERAVTRSLRKRP